MSPKVDPDKPTQTPQPSIPNPPRPDVEPDIDLNKPFDGDDPTDKDVPNTIP